MIIEYKAKINLKHIFLIYSIGLVLLSYTLYSGDIGESLWIVGFCFLLFICLPYYSNLKFEKNQVIYKKKALTILSYIESETFFGGDKWGWTKFGTHIPRTKMLRIQTNSKVFYIYENNCYNYKSIKEILINNNVEFSNVEFGKRQVEIENVDNLHTLIMKFLVIIFLIVLVIFLLLKII